MARLIVGREAEVTVLHAIVTDPEPDPRALLIEGDPGIGKTTLLRELTSLARDHGLTVLGCRPTRTETDLSYAGLVELLDAIGDQVVNALLPPQARVLRTVLRRDEPDGVVDRLSLGVALVAAVRAVAASGPLLIAVDDAQWLDPPTAKTLAFAIRRLAGMPVRVAVVRSRSAWPNVAPGRVAAVDWADELGRAVPDQRVDSIRLGPLDPSELSRIMRRALGWAPAWPRLLRIAELSGGNPMYALELARAIGGPDSTADLTGVVPDRVVDLARSRIVRLPRRVREALELVSVPHAPTVDLIRRLDPAALDIREALAAAERSGIVTIEGHRIRFAHPILAAAVYGAIPTLRKRELHHAVALLSDELEERARHLAIATETPDAQVAATLEAAAERAWRRGAPDAAADLLRLACRLTEPADVDVLALRRIAYGRILHGAGDAPRAIAELTAVANSLPAGPIRARANFHLMYVTRMSGYLGRAVQHGIQAAADAADDPALQAEMYELLSRISDENIARKLDAARLAVAALDRVARPDPNLVFQVRAAVVEAEFYAGLGIHLELLEGLDPSPRPQFPPSRSALGGDDLIGRLLTYSGRIDEGIEVLRGLYDRAAVQARATLPAVLSWMAEAQIMAGRFAEAAALTAEAIEHNEETGGSGGNPWEAGFHAIALAMLGHLDEADALATTVIDAAAADPLVSTDEAPARLALGLVAMAREQHDHAVTHLRHLDDAKRAAGIREPRLWAHTSDLIEALVATGALDDAGEHLRQLDEDAERSHGQWSAAAAARCRAVLFSARGQLDAALSAAQQAVDLFDGSPMPFERARALLVLGQVHRRRKEKRLALAALTAALSLFDAAQTPVWSERTRAEIGRIPQRRTQPSAADTLSDPRLTPTEATIAQLVAEGLTNREIAGRMFLSPKTVEVNLTRIYRKLGVRSRAGLAREFLSPPPHSPTSPASPNSPTSATGS